MHFYCDTIKQLFYNVLFGVASFSLLNILNIPLNINIVICKEIYLLSCCFKTRFFVNVNLPSNQWKNHLTVFFLHDLHPQNGFQFQMKCLVKIPDILYIYFLNPKMTHSIEFITYPTAMSNVFNNYLTSRR